MGEQLRLDEKVAVVTGGGRGLGAAHAKALADRGAAVVVNAFTPTGAEEVAAEIEAAGGRAETAVADIATEAGGAAVIDVAQRAFGRVDVLVNNAGVSLPKKPFAECTAADFERTIGVHVMGAFHVTKAAWPRMVEQGYGRIVNMGSQAGYFGTRGHEEYCAAKGAIHGFTRSLSFEAAEHGIGVNLIVPTAATRSTAHNFSPAALEALDPALVAAAVVWLAHESCRANGECFSVIAGRVSRLAIAEAERFHEARLTPELVSARLSALDGTEPILFEAGEAFEFDGTGAGYVRKVLTERGVI